MHIIFLSTHPFADKCSIAFNKIDDAIVIFGNVITCTSALQHLECCK